MKPNLFTVFKEKVSITKIKPNPNNPRIIKDVKFRKLVKSVIDFPQMLEIRPIVVNKDFVVLGGNMRLKACIEAGIKEIYIIKVDLPEAQQKEFIIKDNVGFGEWDWDVLANEWDNPLLIEWGLDVWDFDNADIEIEGNIDDDEIPEQIKTRVKFGEVWQLGEHRVACGDSTNPEHIKNLMNGKTVDLILTDPPYGVSASGGRTQTVKRDNIKKIENDDLRGEQLIKFLTNAFKQIPLKDKTNIYIFYDQKTQAEFITAIKQCNWEFVRTLIWNKNSFGLSGKKGYRPKYEMIAYAVTDKDYLWYGDNSQADVIDNAREKKRHGSHPTVKPIDLMVKLIKNSSQKNDIVVDIFLGSGSTLIACQKTKRVCYAIELDPYYCDVTIERWERFTGQKAKRLI